MEICLWEGHGTAPMTVNDVVALHVVSRREFATAAEVKVALLAVLHLAVLHFEARRQFPTAGLDVLDVVAKSTSFVGIAEEEVASFRMEVCLWKGHGVAPMTVNDVVALHAVPRREIATAAEIKVAPLAVLHFAILHFEVRRQFPTAGLDVVAKSTSFVGIAEEEVASF